MKQSRKRALWLLCSMMAAATAASERSHLDWLDSHYEQTAGTARALWDYAEVGYQEQHSSALLQEQLAQEGFVVEAGVADIPTAFVASYGSGEPVLAILGEFDALPGITQDAVAERALLPEKLAGHACGHNLFGAGSAAAAIAVRHWLEATGNQGTVRFYGTPAEEGGSGKVYMVRAGLFEDVDFALHWHPADRNSAAARTTLANRSAKFRFYGVSAHAAGAPEKGRSALDGVEAMNYMANLMREHVPQQTRIHYVITAGGSAPNVVPDFAEVFYYLRHPEAEMVKTLWQRLESTALGAAEGTGTEVKWEIIHGNHPVLVNETLQRMMDSTLRELGGISYDEEDAAFAREIYSSLDSPTLPLGSEEEVQPYALTLGYGSTDVGDVSMAVPTVGAQIASYVPGTAAHSWQAVAAAGSSIGFRGADLAARALSQMAVRLYQDPALREAAIAEFQERRGGDFHYEALLGDRPPPLDYRK
ncbi:MAG: aminobenzoyl-glutamate utilization protein B [Halieaceae bacterium]|jgi:aminobenzoyl-glutamate utilization protein B